MNKYVKTVLSASLNCTTKTVKRLNDWLLKLVDAPNSDDTGQPTPTETAVEPEIQDEPAVKGEPLHSADDFESLCEKLAEMVKNYDQMATQMPGGEAKDLLADMCEQIIASMNLGGCTAITKESAFNPLRHKPSPFSIVDEGTPILATLRAGVELNGKVLIKAIVKI